MPELDPAAASVLELLAGLDGPPLESLEPAEARAQYALLGAVAPPPDLTGLVVETVEVGGVECVVTRPAAPAGPVPVLVWVHGGGWVIGSAVQSQPTAVTLARAVGCAVVNVEYRLAPEHPYPAGLDDVRAVVRAVLDGGLGEQVDPARCAVGGDSAGGNLSAVVANGTPGLSHQVLVYPATDLTLGHPSVRANGEGHLLTESAMRWFTAHYLAGADPADPAVSPLSAADDVLAVAPPASVVLAGFDPLVDEGRAYADRLAGAGVAVSVHEFPGQIHGFVSLDPVIPDAAVALDRVAVDLRRSFGC